MRGPNAWDHWTIAQCPPGLPDIEIRCPITAEVEASTHFGGNVNQVLSGAFSENALRLDRQDAAILSVMNTFELLLTLKALQLQFQRRLSHGLQVLASYSWAHSIDDGSAGSPSLLSNAGTAGIANATRGPSDFDIRHTFSAGLTYDIPIPKTNVFTDGILRGWSIQSTILVRSAPPVDLTDGLSVVGLTLNGFFADIRPDLVQGQSLYLFGANCASVMQTLGNLSPGLGCPGGKGFNPNAFTDPPLDPVTFAPLRQGNIPRNFLRGFGASQWDFAVHRDFTVHESLKLQFRAEMLNVLNHPNFGQPNGAFFNPALFGTLSGFGLSSNTLGQFLAGGSSSTVGAGAFSSLYQIGGPRSIQLALKLSF